MTEDPIKLYVVVMSILLCVLGVVAYLSWQQASAFEEAIDRAPHEAEMIKEYASEVKSLCDQLSGQKLRQGYKTLIEQAANYNGVRASKLGQETKDKPVPGGKGVERRFYVDVHRSGTSQPMTRDQVARFCSTVERDSRGILKTIEIDLTRHTGADGIPAGREEIVDGDTYTGKMVFGLRIVN